MSAAFHRLFGCLFGTQKCIKNKSAAIYPIENNDPLNKTNYLLLEKKRSRRQSNDVIDRDICQTCSFLFSCKDNDDLTIYI